MKIMQNPANKQMTLTLPKQLMESMGWEKGDILKIDVTGKNRLEVSKKPK
jgi:bifunctional DNA-binding transcriptional regulator/antitoxin component of YhaV-PrlF toxin-antitoxin module